jgi:hypothetical protein
MRRILPAVTAILALVACSSTAGSGGTGSVQVFVVAEDSITRGIAPGTDREQIQDGWAVSYSRFLVTLGRFHAQSSSTGSSFDDASVWVLDLRNAPAGGYVIVDRSEIPSGRYDHVGQDMPQAQAGVRAVAPTSAADVKLMVDNGYSLYFEGTLTKPDGQSCKPSDPTICKANPTIKFRWGFAIGTSFDDCAPPQGDSGFAVPVSGAVQVKPTIHGDHWFFSDLTQGAEVTLRYAQYIADSDLDGDGETTLDELKRVKSSDVFPAPRYRLSGTVGNAPIATAFDYVQAQARTLLHFEGDGDCPTHTILK